MPKTDIDYKNKLTNEQYKALREGVTETPFTGELLYNKENGDYLCAACGNVLFDSESKFDSGSGWLSFNDVKDTDSVRLVADTSHNMQRVEIKCSKCDSHLGHVFNDAPDQPTGMRFCVNSNCLKFQKKGD